MNAAGSFVKAPLHVGQLNLPPWDAFRGAFEDIFARRHYANHGPLEKRLDQALADRFQVRHAVSVVNGTVALILLLKALEAEGEVITPAFTFPATAQSLLWAGLKPVFCDVDPRTHTLTADCVADCITPATVAILGVHLWGRPCDPVALERLAQDRGVKLVFDAAHATACAYEGRRVGGFGDAEIFSFHATKILNGAEGGCITTNDDTLAARLRLMRSFRDSSGPATGLSRMNAKISEAQAAMVLLGLDHLEELIADNRLRYERYHERLAAIPGIRFIDHAEGGISNYQSVVAEVDSATTTRDALLRVLHAEHVLARRYFAPGLHRIPPFSEVVWTLPVTNALCQSLIQFPAGQAVGLDDVDAVCAIVRRALETGRP